MESIAITRTMDIKELRRLARLEKSGWVAARMLAIANVLSGMSRGMAAQLAGMERQTLRDWVHRFNAEGVEGLRDRPRSGRPCELTEADRKKLCEIVEKGPNPERDNLVRWRRIDLKKWLEAECGAVYHERSVGKLLKRFGYSHMSVRQINPDADPALIEDFKKTSPKKSRKSSLNTPKTKPSNSGSRTKRVSGKKAR
jgi:transposase